MGGSLLAGDFIIALGGLGPGPGIRELGWASGRVNDVEETASRRVHSGHFDI